jgi:hypothetical protein
MRKISLTETQSHTFEHNLNDGRKVLVEVEYLYFPKISDNVNTASSDWDLREELYIEDVYITDKNDTLLDESLVSEQTILRELYMSKMLNDSF